MSNIKHYIWSSVGTFGIEILGFIGNILIAHILCPDDYGLVAMLAIITQLALSFTSAGFNDYLIKERDSDNKDFGTVATYNICIGSFMYIIIFLCSPLIADFYNEPRLVLVARVLAFSIVLKSLTMTGFVRLTKELRFKTNTTINLLCSVGSIMVTYTMALCGMGYWALAIQPLVIAAFNLFFLLTIGHWRPYFCFDRIRFKEMFAFSSNLLLSYIITTIGTNAYSIIIGKYYSATSLGYYNQAHKMQIVPTKGINGVMLSTSYPIIAKEKDANKRYTMYVELFKRFNFIQTLLVAVLIGIGEAFFYILLGNKWMPSVPLFHLFMIIALTFPLVTINNNIVKMQSRSDIYRNLSIVQNALVIIALIVSAPFSITWIIIGQIIANFIGALFYMHYCGRTIEFTLSKQIKIWRQIAWKPAVALLIAGTIVQLLHLDIIISACIRVVCLIVVFIAICELTSDKTYQYFKQHLITITKKVQKRND